MYAFCAGIIDRHFDNLALVSAMTNPLLRWLHALHTYSIETVSLP